MNIQYLEQFIANENIKLVDAMQKIDNNANQILFVVDDKEQLSGVLTDGDIRRWLLKTGQLNVEIKYIMNSKPLFVKNSNLKDSQKIIKKNMITAVPVINKDNKIINIIFEKRLSKNNYGKNDVLSDVSVVIMAGGKGTRLYPYTKILPKPLIPIGDIPIVERIIDCFCNYGVKDFFMTVNYKKIMIQSYFAEINKDYSINFVEEDKPLGTAGSLKLINKKFEKPIFVINCDVLIKADYEDIYNYHKHSGNAITLVVAMKNEIVPYGVIHIKENGEIDHMEEKPKHSYLINAGMYIINPDIVELTPKDTFFHMTDLIECSINKGYRVGVYPISEDSFLDMGQFEEMKRMEKKLNIQNDYEE